MTDTTSVGWIGLGLMGKPMVANLRDAGFSVGVFAREPTVAQALAAQGCARANSPADLAKANDVVVLMVADTPAVEAVLFGDSGVIHGIAPGTLVIDMGTTDATATREFAARVVDAGGAYLDAPVSGGEKGAIDGSLSIMVGGDAADLERARPLFQVLGARITHVGDVGSGQVAKAANQVIVGLTITAVAEGLALAAHAGANVERVHEALLGGFARSAILELHGRRMIDDDFKPGAKCTTQHKDLSQALALAQANGLDLPATAQARAMYQRLIDLGLGHLDHSGLFRLYTGGD